VSYKAPVSVRGAPTEAGRAAPWADLPRPRWLIALPGRILDALRRERNCWLVLAVAMVASAALGLWLTRGTTFFIDEVTYFLADRGYDLKALLSPHNGHLIFVPRLIYATVFKLFGADYLVFRILQVVGLAGAAGLFFVLAKRRVGHTVALGPAVLLLFLGSGWVITLTPEGITHVYCVIACLGALVALESRLRFADAAACALLVVAVATFSIGLAFVFGVAVSVLLRPDRWRRAWIFLVPAAVYLLWLVAAPKLSGLVYLSGTGLRLENALLIPSFVGEAAAAVAAAASGLSYDFANPTGGDVTYPAWGVVVAVIAVVALAFRIRRGRIPASLWMSLAILLGFWASTALVSGRVLLGDTPQAGRYVYAGVVVALLVAADAARGLRFSRRAVGLVLIAAAFALAGNIALLRQGSPVLRDYAAGLRSQLAAIVVARRQVAPDFTPSTGLASFVGPEGAGAMLSAFDRNGSFAFTVPELVAQSEQNREAADSTVVAAERLALAPASGRVPARGCRRLSAEGGAPVELTVRSPGVILRSSRTSPVTLGRFADTPTVAVGTLRPGTSYALQIPRDFSSVPWRASVPPGTPLTACALGGGG
jgi:hypothetical protein